MPRSRARSVVCSRCESRPKPFRDEKILTGWGALMISALAEAGAALGAPEMVKSAESALAFLEGSLVERSGASARVLRLAKGDVKKGPGFLDDHAYLANAALDIYEVTGSPAPALLARALVDGMLAAFHSDAGFFFTPSDGETLITRSTDAYDNAVPSGVSMACRALQRLGALMDAKYMEIAERELLRLYPAAVGNPFGYGQLLCELDRLVRGSVDIVLVGARSDSRTQSLAAAVFAKWLPNRNVAWLDPTDARSLEACPLLADGKPAQSTPCAYVCRGRTCSLPVTTAAELSALL